MDTIDKIVKDYANSTLTKLDYCIAMHEHYKSLHSLSSMLKDSYIKEISLTSQGVIFTSEADCSFIDNIEDIGYTSKGVINLKMKRLTELDMMLKLMDSANVVFDIGANIGFMALHFAKKYPAKTVLAFEPAPRTYEFLRKNIALNPLISNVTAYNFGFSDVCGTQKFYYYPEVSGASSLGNDDFVDNKESINCIFKTLDEFCDQENIFPDFLKLDIEGAELLALRGGSNIIENYKPMLFMEMLRKWAAKFNYHPNDIIKFLAKLGYGCYISKDNFLQKICEVTDDTSETNFVFLNYEKHAKTIDELNKC